MLKISIVTVSYNSSNTIANTLRSVASQQYPNVEHIIIDGASKDNTVEIVKSVGTHVAQLVTEPDNGIYDAMNKGLALATGDIVSFLNSDDEYSDETVLSDVAEAFLASNVDFIYGDLQMVDRSGKTARYWKTGLIPSTGLASMQIPHPVFFVRRQILNELNPAFDTSFRIAADLKQQLLLINKKLAKGFYIERVLARMSLGGASTGSFLSYAAGWRESTRAYNDVYGSKGWLYTLKKVISKLRGVRRIC